MHTRHTLALLLWAALALTGEAPLARADQKAATPAARRGSALPTLDEARAQAQKARRTLVLEFGAKWCQPCKEFERHVLSLPTVQKALAEVVFVRYDAEELPGQPAARLLKVIGYPTMVAVGQDGREIDRIEGFRGPRQFLEWLGRVSLDYESDESLLVRMNRDPNDAEALLVSGRRQSGRGQDAQAEATLTKAAAAAAGKNEAIGAAADWELRIVRLRRMLREAPRKEMAEHILAYPRSSNAEAAFRELTRRGPADSLTSHALDRYVEVRLDQATLKDQKGQDVLNEAVYGCLRVGAYDPAERAARRLVSIDDKNPLFLDTLAEVLHLRGDRTQAMTMSTRALAAVEKQGAEGKELRAVLLKNQARFSRAAHELPAELLNQEEEELSPWERTVEPRR